MLKFIFVIIYLIVFAIISLPLYAYTAIAKKIDEKKAAAISQSIVKKGFRILLVCLRVKTKVIGIENIPKDENVLFVGNHRSYADIAVSYAELPVLTGFVAKKEMKSFPCINVWLTKMNGVFLDRENPKEGLKAILKAIENVKKGYSMFIMPEGTRNQKDEMLPFKKGSLKIAEKTGCKIVPVAFTNTDEVFERHFPKVKAAKIVMEFGKAIDINDYSKEEQKDIHTIVQALIKDMLDKNINKA